MKTSFLLPALLVTALSAPLGAAEEVKASHILVRNQDEADVIRNEVVEKGGDLKAFMAAARKHSKDVNSKRAGGALGWFTRGKMVREFSDEAFNLKTGEMSHPVKTQYGWHIIFVEDRRDQTAQGPVQEGPIQIRDPQPLPPGGKVAANPAGKDAQKAEADPHAGHNHPPGDHGKATPPANQAKTTGPDQLAPQPQGQPKPAPVPGPTPGAEAAKVQVHKPRLPARALKLTLDIKEKLRRPEHPVDVELTLQNLGEETQKVIAPDLLPLGLTVTGEVAPQSPPATWDELKAKKPETPFLTLTSRRSVGGTFSLSDYFKDLPPNGRYRLVWRPQVFFQNLEQNFKEIAALPDYAALKTAWMDGRLMRREVAGASNRFVGRNPEGEATFSIFEPITGAPIGGAAAKKYYASIELEGQNEPLWVELFADRQPEGVRQFANLALEGFYDQLALFDVQKGNFIRAGCPRDNGTGTPERMAYAQNAQKVPHEKGTLSLISRPGRGTAREVGSIFFICRKPQPDWDAEHVPFGKIISGEAALDRVEGRPGITRMRRVAVVPESLFPSEVARPGSPAVPTPVGTPPTPGPVGPDGKPLPARALPVATIKTPKGELTVELFEDDAANTVANFIELAEKGFFNQNAAEKKEMTFYFAVPGTLLLTGSPTNDNQGNPGYRIASETAHNKQPHLKGTLTMLVEQDPQSGNPVPDTAGSQFMICLRDMPSWNGLYTPFARVTQGMEVLDKLVQGDKIESIAIVSKRNRPYKAQTQLLR